MYGFTSRVSLIMEGDPPRVGTPIDKQVRVDPCSRPSRRVELFNENTGVWDVYPWWSVTFLDVFPDNDRDCQAKLNRTMEIYRARQALYQAEQAVSTLTW